MDFKQKVTDSSLRHYKLITVIMVVFTLGLGALIPLTEVDTNPAKNKKLAAIMQIEQL